VPNNEWGDFQTPPELAAAVRATLPSGRFRRILEPTCGVGNFLAAFSLEHGVERFGVEINHNYAETAQATGSDVLKANIFDLDLSADVPWRCDGELLVIGNPPWVTAAQLGKIGSINLPEKSNLKKLSGFDAMTGSSNFDIAEFITLKLMVELAHEKPTVALLVKTQVARNVLLHAARFELPYSHFEIRRIDAQAWFGASVDACLFSMQFSSSANYSCDVFGDLSSSTPLHQIGVVHGQLVANLDLYRQTSYADGRSPIEWRSGVKHDASAVMELPNEVAESLQLEDEYLFPMLKCSDIFRERLEPTKQMVVPQHRFGEDTAHLSETAPRLWRYLTEHGDLLDGRRSAIYKNQPRFTLFGLGDYTFRPYKIAISGFHKQTRFVLLGPHNGKPLVFDDASYSISFDDPAEAAMTFAILTDPAALDLVSSLTFWDSKRPINKKLLQRIDLAAIAEKVAVEDLTARADLAASRLGVTSDGWQDTLARLLAGWAEGEVGDDPRLFL
jgi:hypothetical protein